MVDPVVCHLVGHLGLVVGLYTEDGLEVDRLSLEEDLSSLVVGRLILVVLYYLEVVLLDDLVVGLCHLEALLLVLRLVSMLRFHSSSTVHLLLTLTLTLHHRQYLLKYLDLFKAP